ncbi:MAG: Nif11-like leader peptide family natural product precursor [Alkalinema sp. CAN_BIN05]|nr:Nif11-like leader peptide family natural product precursor [Alkalinema sp. CAN_BIN05]
MSIKSAARFLSAASRSQEIRDRFQSVQSPEHFLCISQEMGYTFTTAELKKIITLKSRNIEVRRTTGVWRWLREVNWVERRH